jgi:hypothetical protein
VPGPVGEASVSYRDLHGRVFTDRLSFEMWPAQRPLPLGLARGRLLVDEITTLKAAAAAHLEKNDQETAFRLVRAVKTRFLQSGVPGLEGEVALLTRLDETLTKLSGHAGEPVVLRPRNALTGLPD